MIQDTVGWFCWEPKAKKGFFFKAYKLSRRTLVHSCHRQTHRGTCMSRIMYIIHTTVCLYICLYQSVCVYLFVCLACLFLYVYVSGSLCFCPSVCLFVCLRQSVRVSDYLPDCLFVSDQPVCFSSGVCLLVSVFVSVSLCVPVCLPARQPVCLSLRPSVYVCFYVYAWRVKMETKGQTKY